MSLRTITARMGLALACAFSLGLGLACGGGGGTKTPSPIVTTPAATPSFTTPASQIVTVGGNATFTVNATVTDGGTLSYQWMKGSTAVGTNSKTLAFNPVALNDAGTYKVTVTNTLNGDTASAKSVTSDEITLTVNPVGVVAATPSFTTPAPQTVSVGSNVTFTVDATVTDGGTLSYQWTKGGTAIGTNSKALAFNPVALNDAGTYKVTVTNTLNGDTANAKSVTSDEITLTVNPVVIAVTPTFITPAPQTVTVGANATFTVNATVTDGGTLSYQWTKGTTALTDQTASSLVFNSVTLQDAGTYKVTVTNTLNGDTAHATSVASGDITLTVNPVVVAATPIFTTPASQTVMVGGNATFTVDATVTDGGTLSYQWTKGGAAIGTNSKTLAFNSVALTDAGTYRITVTNTLNGDTANAKSTTSGDITLTVPEPTVTIKQDPASTEVTVPDGATFTVKATTSTANALHYTWKRNRIQRTDVIATTNDAFTSIDSPTLTIAFTDLRNVADTYTVTVSDGVTTVTSSPATLTVKAPRPVYAGDPAQNLGHIYQVLSSRYLDAPADTTLGSFRVGYDSTVLNPAWSATCFFPIRGNFTNTRPSGSNAYPNDPRVTPSALYADYTGSPYSRGHQTGYADLATRYGQAAGNSTMYMTNMCPQTQYLNGGVWVDLAEVLNGGLDDAGSPVASFSNSFGRVWVYTGPIFADKLMEPIGTNKVQIPSAYYNIVVRETEAAGDSVGTPKVLALITPHNCSIYDTTPDKNGVTVGYRALDIADCWKFVTTVDRVQELTGLTFFPAPTSTLPTGFTSTVDVRGWGSVLENGIGKPNVHMISPSWDSTFSLGSANTIVKVHTINVNTPFTFVGQATTSGTGTASTIASTTWNFGDGVTALTPSTTHAYSTAGDYLVTFTAMDGAGVSNSISRVITVFDPALPTISAIPSANTNNTKPKTVTFTVADGVPASSGITVTATSSNTSVLANPLSVVNTNGTCTLNLTPVADSIGTSTVTITIANNDGKTATQTFAFNVFPLLENFTQASAVSSYASSNYTLSTGSWTFTKTMSLIGDWSDAKNERQGLRLKADTGSAIAMNFDLGTSSTNISSVSVAYALYLTDANNAKTASFSLSYLKPGGSWTKIGDSVTATSHDLSTATFDCTGLTGPIRFKLAVDGTPLGRLNLDDFKVQ